jgi:hypothetical protein
MVAGKMPDTSPRSIFMRVAYIILAHSNFDMLRRLVFRLNNRHTVFAIHIDARADDRDFFGSLGLSNVCQVSRLPCYWGSYNIVAATVLSVRLLLERCDFDYAVLLSGSDYPIKNPLHVIDFLSENRGKEFIESFSLLDEENPWSDNVGRYQSLSRISFRYWRYRSRVFKIPFRRKWPGSVEPHGGSQWWALSRQCLEACIGRLNEDRAIERFFRTTYIPDELFFQTVIAGTKYAEKVTNKNLHFVDWGNPNPSVPATMTIEYQDTLRNSDKFFARKFDIARDPKILDLLDEIHDSSHADALSPHDPDCARAPIPNIGNAVSVDVAAYGRNDINPAERIG